MTELRIKVSDTDFESLHDWLCREPELRGRFKARPAQVADGAMGAPVELIVAATAGASVVASLSRCLATWLVQRRSDVALTVKGPSGHVVSIDARRVNEVDTLLKSALATTIDRDTTNAPGPSHGS